MKKKYEIMRDLLNTFTRITTGIVIVAAIYIQIFWADQIILSAGILWEILTVAFLTMLGNVVFYIKKKEEVSRNGLLVRMVIDLIYVNAVVLGCGFLFGWFRPENWKMLVGMEIGILAVYWGIMCWKFQKEKRTALQMNEKLRQRKKEKE